MDMSNKSLALLLVAAIVISLGGTIISLNKITGTDITGRAAQRSGYVNVTINTNGSCIIDNNVNFGSGKPTTNMTLSTDVNNNGGGFTCDGSVAGTGLCWGLLINNTGNVKLNISMNSSVNGTGLLGGTHSEYDFTWTVDDTELETNSCQGEDTTWRNVNQSNMNNSNVCYLLNFTDGAADTVVIDYNITINQNTIPGEKTAAITIGCVDAS
jgi:hypothetical protein